MLQRHSNPTKNKVCWPRQTKLLVGFGLRFLRFFFNEFLQVCDVFFCGLWRSCFIKNLVLLTKTKTLFLAQKPTQNNVLIARPVFFRDLVDVGYMMMISSCGKLSIFLNHPCGPRFIYIYKIYVYLLAKSMYIYINIFS